MVITLYLILDFLCTSGEKGGIWRLCRDLKKENGEPSPNVMTLRSDDVLVFISPTSRRSNVRTFQHHEDLISEILRYKGEGTSFEKGRRREEIGG